MQETTADFTTFGSDLFTQFYGHFQNDYAKKTTTVSLYKNYDALFSAVGTGPYQLSTIDCPFGYLCPSPSLLWLWITLGALGFVVIVGLGVYYYKKRQDSLGDSMADKAIVYGTNTDAAEQKLIGKSD